MGWSDIIGEPRVKRLLSSAIERGRVAHAYLFTGPEGIGKDATALEFARALCCPSAALSAEGLIEACGHCPDCRRAVSLEHPDIHIVFSIPRGKGTSSNDPVENLSEEELRSVRRELAEKAADPYHHINVPRAAEIRIDSVRMIRRFASMSSSTGRWKTFLVFNADELNEEASDALLKTLEEPPAGTVIVLTSSFAAQLRPTIVSRCETVQFDLLGEEEIENALRTRLGIDEGEARLAARLSGGSYRHAVEVLGEDLQEWRNEVVDFIGYSLTTRYALLARRIEQWAKADRQAVTNRLRLMLSWVRDVFLLQTGSPERVLNIDMESRLERFVGRYRSARTADALGSIELAIGALDRNGNTLLVLANLAAELRRNLAEKEADAIPL